jgi:hypothetical protein
MATAANWKERLREIEAMEEAALPVLKPVPKLPKLPKGGAEGAFGTFGTFGKPRRSGNAWSSDDWMAFYDERAAIVEHDGGATRKDAETAAYEHCLIEWLNQHAEPTEPHAGCAWCKRPESNSAAIIPFGAGSSGRTWLHHECWQHWHGQRRQRAMEALAEVGIANLESDEAE